MPTKQTGGQEGFPTVPTERSKNCFSLKVAIWLKNHCHLEPEKFMEVIATYYFCAAKKREVNLGPL